jgi:predicted carbohydrate-binding protein with CBM5 and CBM33 domain
MRRTRGRRPRWVAAVITVLSALTLAVVAAAPAQAHGAMMVAGSRTFLCYKDGVTSSGQVIPQNPACQAAVTRSGTNSLYNWFAVGNRSGATSGGTVGFIPDGKLCSGNSNYYDFFGFDIASADWPKTHLTSGATVQYRYNKWAAHPGTFRLYITKDGWNPNHPLTWADMETTPFYSVTDPPSVGGPGSIDSYYYWNAALPANKTGNHIIYSVWARSDSTETFYGCSDVTFDGGNGEVTGIGQSGPPPTGTACTATYKTSSTWQGGFQAEVTVTNPSTATQYGWTANWVLADGETINSAWNGTLSQAGSLASVKSTDWNRTLPPGGSASFGFTASSATVPAVPSVTCQSP